VVFRGRGYEPKVLQTLATAPDPVQWSLSVTTIVSAKAYTQGWLWRVRPGSSDGLQRTAAVRILDPARPEPLADSIHRHATSKDMREYLIMADDDVDVVIVWIRFCGLR